MTDEQARVFSSLSRGRLIFPFREEADRLRSLAKSGPLTSDESERLAALEDGYKRVKVKDQGFHASMESGNLEAAGRIAEEALAICKDLA